MIVQQIESNQVSSVFAFKAKSQLSSLQESRNFLNKLVKDCLIDDRYYAHTGVLHVIVPTTTTTSSPSIDYMLVGLSLVLIT